MSNTKRLFSTRLLVRLALFAALSAVLKPLQIGNDFLRFSFENTPILLCGYLFGPVCGAITGAVGDLLGCLICGYAINPIITLGAGLFGCMAGLFGERGIAKKPRLWLSIASAYFVGSLIVKSFGLWLYFATPLPALALRIPTLLVVGSLEFVILTLILKNKALHALLERI